MRPVSWVRAPAVVRACAWSSYRSDTSGDRLFNKPLFGLDFFLRRVLVFVFLRTVSSRRQKDTAFVFAVLKTWDGGETSWSCWKKRRLIFRGVWGEVSRFRMSSARVDYIAPWWTYWLHNFPHINLRLQPADNSFQPQNEDYQQVRGARGDRGEGE